MANALQKSLLTGTAYITGAASGKITPFAEIKLTKSSQVSGNTQLTPLPSMALRDWH